MQITDLSAAEAADRAADHWNQLAAGPPRGARWWQNAEIVRHINTVVCGRPLDGVSAGVRAMVRSLVPGLPLYRGVAIGAANGAKEMDLVADGVVERMEIFEIAGERVAQGRALAEERGLSDRVTFHERLLDPADDIGLFDLVHWNNALHHMLDVDEWLQWSREVLEPGGVLVMDDFVGPDRFQWTDRQLRYASRFRATLPDRLLEHPMHPGQLLPREVPRPTVEHMISVDPTEAADSSRILGALERHFPHAWVRPTGGVMYSLALEDVIYNVDDTLDEGFVSQAMLLDEALTDMGEFHYAVAIAQV